MANFKQRLAILNSVNARPFDYTKIPDYLVHVTDSALSKPILRRVFAKLVHLDTEISAAFDTLDDEDWESLNGASGSGNTGSANESGGPDNNTVQPHLQELFNNINLFSANFLKLIKPLNNLKFNDLMDVLTPLFRNKTRNIQFILFKIDSLDRAVFYSFLLAKARQEPRTFIPFFGSLLVRLPLSITLKRRAFKAFFAFHSSLTAGSVEHTLACQHVLYMLCFDPALHDAVDDMDGYTDRLFASAAPSKMNRAVVERFCSIYGRTHRAFGECVLECFYAFPFDKPVCKSVAEAVGEDYVEFKGV